MVETRYSWIFTTGADDDDLKELVSNDLYEITGNLNSNDFLVFKYSSKDYDGNYRCLIEGKTEDGEAVFGVSSFQWLFS
jgi:hypothetical protein